MGLQLQPSQMLASPAVTAACWAGPSPVPTLQALLLQQSQQLSSPLTKLQLQQQLLLRHCCPGAAPAGRRVPLGGQQGQRSHPPPALPCESAQPASSAWRRETVAPWVESPGVALACAEGMESVACALLNGSG